MLNRDFECLTVNGVCDLSEKNIIAGTPLTLGADGYKAAGASDKFFGLSFNYFHTGKDDVNGGEWFANSGKIGVVKIGQVTLSGDEIDGTLVYPFDEEATFAAGDSLKVDAEHKLVKITGSEETAPVAVATVVAFKAAAANEPAVLTVFVNCAI